LQKEHKYSGNDGSDAVFVSDGGRVDFGSHLMLGLEDVDEHELGISFAVVNLVFLLFLSSSVTDLRLPTSFNDLAGVVETWKASDFDTDWLDDMDSRSF
jgi:hypothetical protein